VRRPKQGVQGAVAAVARVDAPIVGNVVAVVAQGGDEERGQPDDVDAEVGQVAEPCGHPGQVAPSVRVAVLERRQVHLVADRILPERSGAPPQQEPGQLGQVTDAQVGGQAAQGGDQRAGTPPCLDAGRGVLDHETRLWVDAEPAGGGQEALRVGLATSDVVEGDQQRRGDPGGRQARPRQGGAGTGDHRPGQPEVVEGPQQRRRAWDCGHGSGVAELQLGLAGCGTRHRGVVQPRCHLPHGRRRRPAVRDREHRGGVDAGLVRPGLPGPLHRSVGVDQRPVHVEQHRPHAAQPGGRHRSGLVAGADRHTPSPPVPLGFILVARA
jgi:hypothetical protein